jgi:hypothetical protein
VSEGRLEAPQINIKKDYCKQENNFSISGAIGCFKPSARLVLFTGFFMLFAGLLCISLASISFKFFYWQLEWDFGTMFNTLNDVCLKFIRFMSHGSQF